MDSITTNPGQIPKLVIIEQTPHVEHDNPHTVVKNVPFFVTLGSAYQTTVDSPINLNHLSFEGKLLYDTDDIEDKEVDYVASSPIEVRKVIPELSTTHEVKLQVRIKVLSRHHENLLFRVKILALNPITGKEFHELMTVKTAPIKVISKPERKKGGGGGSKLVPLSAPLKSTPQKRAADPSISLIKTISESQIQQQNILNTLMSQIPKVDDINQNFHSHNKNNMFACGDHFCSTWNSSSSSSLNHHLEPMSKVRKTNDNFEEELSCFLNMIAQIPPNERHAKIKKLVQNSSVNRLEQFQNMFRLIVSETFHSPLIYDAKDDFLNLL